MSSDKSFFRQIGYGVFESEKFKYHGYRSTFVLHRIQEAVDPQEILKKCLQQCIEEAVANSEEKGHPADHLGVEISSPELSFPIGINIRPFTENTIDLIFNRFNAIDQSFKVFDDEEVERSRLLDSVLTVKVDTLTSTQLRPRLEGGAGVNLSRRPISLNVKRSSLIPIESHVGNYCLFYAIELTRIWASKEMTAVKFYQLMRNRGKQWQRVESLLHGAEIPRNLNTYDAKIYVPKVQVYFDSVWGKGKYKIFVFDDACYYKPVLTSSNDTSYDIALPIYHHGEHFDGIKHMGSFFNAKAYCFHCERTYDRASRHSAKCKARCMNCSRVGGRHYPCPAESDYEITCATCTKIFKNRDCYEHHLKVGLCRISRRCPDCGTIYKVEVNTRNGRLGHKCGEAYCRKCNAYHPKGDQCYIAKKPLPPVKNARFVIYDIECTQDTESEKGSYSHVPNFIAATVICNRCIESGAWRERETGGCEICGAHRTLTWSPVTFSGTSVSKATSTQEPLNTFLKWLLYELPRDYPSYALAHYGSRYDMALVFREIFALGALSPEIIRQGTKLYRMVVDKRGALAKTIFLDTYNFMQLRLSKLVETFNLEVEEKKYFPHMYNRSVNYGVTLPHLPPKDDYLYKGMKEKEKGEFESWYAEHCMEPFNLSEKLAEYCVSDVEILTHAVVEFRRIFLDITHFDIFQNCTTMAGACMQHYIINYMKENTLGIVRELGYERRDRASGIALKYLKWYAHSNGVMVRHRDSAGGEFYYRQYKLDGYVAAGGERNRPLAIEVHGCVWHGCPRCFPSDQAKMPDGKTAGEKLRQTLAKQKEIEEEMDLHVVWECEIHEQLKTNLPMREFFESCYDTGPIRPRDCFFGGRTENLKLLATANDEYKISYKDFNSLYPYICFTTLYPIKHPEVIVFDQGDGKCHWTGANQNPYRGILKVRVVPPQHLRVPVLPMKVDERLLFSLCRTCALKYPHGARVPGYRCTHGPREREFITTCTHMELNVALNDGYVVEEVYRVWRYHEWSADLFKPYIRDWMQVKIHSSGWPIECRECEEEQLKFIEENRLLFGFEINASEIKRNEGRRVSAKFSCNCLWGRFSLRNKLSKTRIVSSPSALADIVEDYRIEMNSIDAINDDTLMVTTTERDEFVSEHPVSNVIISLWTTSAARLKLLSALKRVLNSPGAEILYMDTDSVIYRHRHDADDPLPTGRHFGELTDEVPEGWQIAEFVCGGPKNYSLLLNNPSTGKYRTVMKIRGLTLNWNCCQLLPYDVFRYKAVNYGREADRVVLDFSSSNESSPPQWLQRDFPLDNFRIRKFVSDGEWDAVEVRKRANHYGFMALSAKQYYIKRSKVRKWRRCENRDEYRKLKWCVKPSVLEYSHFIKKSRLGHISTTRLSKVYRPVVQKGIVDEHLNVLPFGYAPPPTLNQSQPSEGSETSRKRKASTPLRL